MWKCIMHNAHKDKESATRFMDLEMWHNAATLLSGKVGQETAIRTTSDTESVLCKICKDVLWADRPWCPFDRCETHKTTSLVIFKQHGISYTLFTRQQCWFILIIMECRVYLTILSEIHHITKLNSKYTYQSLRPAGVPNWRHKLVLMSK